MHIWQRLCVGEGRGEGGGGSMGSKHSIIIRPYMRVVSPYNRL